MILCVWDEIGLQKNMDGINRTALKYDSFYRSEDSLATSTGFRSSKSKRHIFEEQKKSDFQDDEDIEEEFGHMKLISNYKNLCDALDLELESFEKESTKSVSANVKKAKKKRVRLNHVNSNDDDAEQDLVVPNLSIGLRKVNSNMKFQKSTMKNDIVFTNFLKSETIPAHNPKLINQLPMDYKPFYSMDYSNKSNRLTSKSASNILKSRFTNSSNGIPTESQEVKPKRTIITIKIAPILKTRLGI